ncbi:MAG: nuclear transport factor 2 family protein [Bacteroidia bacterium]|nr:nuclear transport factor 2 family protein [Bacteroidia bacterium]
MENKNRTIAQNWFDAFNAKNLDALLSLYDENAEHFSPKLKIRMPETGGFIKGKQQLHDWWKDAFDRLSTLHYKPNYFIADSDKIFMEYVRTVTGEDDLIVGEVLSFKNGKIIASKVFHS